jgi:hypothetical protein
MIEMPTVGRIEETIIFVFWEYRKTASFSEGMRFSVFM